MSGDTLLRNRNRARALLARFGAAREGATAVEFAMVALPFFTLLFAILELGLVFMVSTSLDNATDGAARRIRTGEMQTEGGTAVAFKTEVCERMFLLSDCASKLSIDVRTFDQFADIDMADPVEDGDLNEDELTFEPGGPEDIVLVRAYYEWSLITPLLNDSLATLSDGRRLITTAATFRNEPYEQ